MSKWICNGVEFKVGDKVKVVRKVMTRATDGMGTGVKWCNSWQEEMNASIGEVFTIEWIDEYGAKLSAGKGNVNSYGYPLSAFEKVVEKNLPVGEFTLVDLQGVEYQAHAGAFSTHVQLHYNFPLGGNAVASVLLQEAEAALNDGRWSVVDKERVKKVKALASLTAKKEILTNEIEQLEKELAE